jgi:nucleoside-diphosphate-sugar epimerase
VDVRDVAAAVDLALTVPLDGHHRALLCAGDIAGSAPALELAARLAPGVPVTDPGRYRSEPWAALVDCSAAASALGWRPSRGWASRGRGDDGDLSAADPPRPARPPTP